MSSISQWIDDRIDMKTLRAQLIDRRVPWGLTWWHTLGSATLTVFFVQVVTGVVMAMYYSPSPDHAYDSIRYIESHVLSGHLLRGIHHWGASAMVVLVVAHMIRVFSLGSYKYPREMSWLFGVGLLFIVLGFSFTGYLLPWDQKAYWATQVGTNIAGSAPLVGGIMVNLLRGGAQLGAAAQQFDHDAANERGAPGDVGPHLGGPIRLLVPRQQVAGERETQHDEQQPDAEQPAHFAGVLVGTETEDADHVGHDEDHHGRGAPVVDATEEVSAQDMALDVANAVVGMIGRRGVVHRHDHAGHHLHEEHRQRGAAKRMPPGESPRHPAIDQLGPQGLHVDPIVNPLRDRGHAQASRFSGIPSRKSLYWT